MRVTCARRRRGNPYAAWGHGGGAWACRQEQRPGGVRAQRSVRELAHTDGVVVGTTSPPDGAAIARTGSPGTGPGAMMGDMVKMQALRQAGTAASDTGSGQDSRAGRGSTTWTSCSRSSRWRTSRARRPSPRMRATTWSRSAARSCRRGPTASRGRGEFRTGHGPLIDSFGVCRLQTMRRSSRYDRLRCPPAASNRGTADRRDSRTAARHPLYH